MAKIMFIFALLLLASLAAAGDDATTTAAPAADGATTTVAPSNGTDASDSTDTDNGATKPADR